MTKFDTTHSPVALYLFENNLLDSSGNGFNLTGTSPIFRPVYNNIIGLSPPIQMNRGGVSDTSLRILGDITVQAHCVMRSAPSGAYIAEFAAVGETEATNFAWSIQLSSQNSLAYFTEYGPGTNTSYTVTPTGKGLPALGVPFHVTMRRKVVSGGVIVDFFVNGVPFGSPSGVLPAPSGATTSQLLLNDAGTNPPDIFGLKIIAAALTDAEILAEYDRTLGQVFGTSVQSVQSLWTGALTTDGATVALQLSYPSDNVRLAVTDTNSNTTYSSSVAVGYNSTVKLSVTGLDNDTDYTYVVQSNNETVSGINGKFHTLPDGYASFKIAFGGDSITGSNSTVFDTIRSINPLMFLQMGDLHYHNYTTNDQSLFQAAFNEVLSQPRQGQLYREIPTCYVWDDHDFGNNNCDSTSPSKPAAAAVYRLRVPHYSLPDSTSVYQTFDIGRVRFIITDQRSAATPDSATDNSSKSILGTAQKTWFKNLLSNSSGMLIVWVCPRWFGFVQTAGSDSWGGFSTERAEIVSHIHTNCPGRVIVLSADMHALGIDSGANHDFLPGGGEPLPTFQAAPLDIAAPGGAGTYDQGGYFINNGQFGTMEITDSGGSSLGVVWKGYSLDTQLTSYSFNINI